MANEKTKFNLTVAALWPTAKGGYITMPVGDEQFDALQQIEKGGKLIIKVLEEKSRKSEKSPYAYLEYLSKEEVARFAAERDKPSGKFTRKASSGDADSI